MNLPTEVSWIKVDSREDMGHGGTTRVLMFVRGVGLRTGTMTALFENPWHVTDPDWMGTDRNLNWDDVAYFINLDMILWPHDLRMG